MDMHEIPAGLLVLDTAIFLALALLARVTRPMRVSMTLEERYPRLAPLLPPVAQALFSIERARGGQRAQRRFVLAGLLVMPLTVMLWLLLVALGTDWGQVANNPRGAEMAIEYVIVGLLAPGIAIYLAIALLRPDKF